MVGDRPGAADAPAEAYVGLLRREIDASPPGAPDESPLRSLYFGGGTPSLTPPKLLSQVISTIRERHGLAADCEVTLEMDPGTFDEEKVHKCVRNFRGLCEGGGM